MGTRPTHWIAPAFAAIPTIYFWEPGQNLNIPSIIILVANLSIVLALLIWADGYEREPIPTVVWSVSWGAFPAILIALSLNSLGPNLYLAAVVEEFAKLVGLLIVFSRGSINSPTDAFVIASSIGAGFMVIEDLAYATSSQDVFYTIITRSIFSFFAHSLFSGIGAAVMYLLWTKVGFSGIPVGFIFSYLLHFLWNSVVDSNFLYNNSILWIFAFGIYPPIIMVLIAFFLRRREAQIIKREGRIRIESGLLEPQVLDHILSLQHRRRALASLPSKYDRKSYLNYLNEVVRALVSKK